MPRLWNLLVLPLMLFTASEASTWSFARSTGTLRTASRPCAASAVGDQDTGPPAYISGDECLFCHRADVGTTWQDNRHGLTIRPAELEPALLELLRSNDSLKPHAADVDYVMGTRNRIRLLKRSAAAGRLELLSTGVVPAKPRAPASLIDVKSSRWDANVFGNSCAGCHATQVDSRTQKFSAVSLDCYVCHGNATLDHANDSTKMLLARKRNDPARVVTAVCAQCHVRTGKSKTTGSPYPKDFVAGNELPRDFPIDLSRETMARSNPADRHVLQNVREVLVHDKEDVTCLSCHDVHKQSSKKHHAVASSGICLSCHNASGPKSSRKSYEVHSEVCGY